MSLFEEIKVDTLLHEDDIYVNARQFAWHIAKAIEQFILESHEHARHQKFSKEEVAFLSGIVEGMSSINLLLSQGGVEEEFSKTINTVEDLFKLIGEEDE